MLQRKYKKRRKGAALVEFALAAPVLFALLFGMIEMGRVIFVQNQMSNAAREGCRVAALGNVQSVADVTAAVNAHISSSNLGTLVTTITPADLSSVESGDTITVSLRVPYADASWIPISSIVGDAEIQVNKSLMRE